MWCEVAAAPRLVSFGCSRLVRPGMACDRTKLIRESIAEILSLITARASVSSQAGEIPRDNSPARSGIGSAPWATVGRSTGGRFPRWRRQRGASARWPAGITCNHGCFQGAWPVRGPFAPAGADIGRPPGRGFSKCGRRGGRPRRSLGSIRGQSLARMGRHRYARAGSGRSRGMRAQVGREHTARERQPAERPPVPAGSSLRRAVGRSRRRSPACRPVARFTPGNGQSAGTAPLRRATPRRSRTLERGRRRRKGRTSAGAHGSLDAAGEAMTGRRPGPPPPE
jgi:hypothetical protein